MKQSRPLITGIEIGRHLSRHSESKDREEHGKTIHCPAKSGQRRFQTLPGPRAWQGRFVQRTALCGRWATWREEPGGSPRVFCSASIVSGVSRACLAIDGAPGEPKDRWMGSGLRSVQKFGVILRGNGLCPLHKLSHLFPVERGWRRSACRYRNSEFKEKSIIAGRRANADHSDRA